MHLHKYFMIILLSILGLTLSCSSYRNHNQHLDEPTRTRLSPHEQPKLQHNVDDYGAMANNTDDSKALSFRNCTNLNINNIRVKNPQQIHLAFQNSLNVRASNLRIIAPANSPNTDGIHITGSQNVRVLNSIVRTGDDCVSIVDGSRNVLIKKITCGPGHGISIGSLGKNNSDDKVSNILVDKAIISNTTNGVRIKSWQGGSGYARNIRFQNIVMHNVTNPIIVDQNYCDRKEECPEQYSAVQMENVVYRNIQGTSNSEVAINFDCSKTFPCQSILLDNIVLNREGEERDMKASCSNVRLMTKGRVTPRCDY